MIRSRDESTPNSRDKQRQRKGKRLGRRLFLAACLPVLVSWVRPQLPAVGRLLPTSKAQLDYITIELGGETKLVRSGQELSMVIGDIFTVKDAYLMDKQARPGFINVIGFAHQQAKLNPNEDRGQTIDTMVLMRKPGWSEGGRGKVFAVAAQTGKDVHGMIFIKLVEPTLRFAEIQINGEPRTMRDGETLFLKKSDRFKVSRVVTNLYDDSRVTFQIVKPLDQAKSDTKSAQQYEIRFLRAGRIFAAIPCQVSD